MAQRKLTAPVALPDQELPELTPQQRAFVEGILAGKTASDAYRAAYDCSNSQPNTIWVEASKLKNHTNVALWLAAARKAALSLSIPTLEGHLAELDRLKELSVESGNLGAAVQAEQLRGKVAGHYVDQTRELPSNVDPRQTLKEIHEISPDLAREMAAQHGIAWTAEEGATRH